MSMTQETKVGMFTLAGLAMFAFGAVMLGDFQIKQNWRLHIYFDDADGLPDKGPVKIAGVEVGQVDRIVLTGEKAKVTVKINKGVEIRANGRARVASTGLIGSKYMDMDPGTAPAPVLQDGDRLDGDKSFNFDDVMLKLGEFLKEDPVNGSAGENLRVALSNLRKVSSALEGSIGRQKDDIHDIVSNLKELTQHAKVVSAHLEEITTERKEDVKVALAKIRSVSERMDEITERIQSGKGILGKLVSDEGMGQELKDTMSSVKEAAGDAQKVMGRIARTEAWWDYRQRYDFEDEQFRADVGLKLIPRPGKYYLLQGNNLGAREDRKLPGKDIEKRNTITAVMGKDFGPFTLYGGVIRSAGGAGAKFRPLYASPKWNRRVEIEAEGYNFGRDETIQGVKMDSPVYNAGARVNVIDPWLWAGAQVEDFMERKNINANLNLTFKDEDIAYVLGLVGLAAR